MGQRDDGGGGSSRMHTGWTASPLGVQPAREVLTQSKEM